MGLVYLAMPYKTNRERFNLVEKIKSETRNCKWRSYIDVDFERQIISCKYDDGNKLY